MRTHPRIFWSVIVALLVVATVAVSCWYAYNRQFFASTIVAECSHANEADKALCYTNEIDKVLVHRGLAQAFEVVAASYKADPDFLGFCHSNMHELGAEAYKEFSTTGHIDLTSAASDCGFGFYHGFILEMSYETGSYAQTQSFCAEVGKVLGGDQQYAEGACYHGIGHGVTDGTDPSLWGDPVKLAQPGLSLCAQVATTTQYDYRCDSGVFNSVALMYRDPEYKLDAHDDPYALCRTPSFDETAVGACYEQMNTLVAYVAHYQFPKELALVAQVNDPRYRDLAIQSVAWTFASSTALSDLSDAAADASACRSFSGADLIACTRGLTDRYMEFGTPGSEYKEALGFCESAGLSGAQEGVCVDEIAAVSQGIYSPAQQREVCQSLPTTFMPASCRSMTASAGPANST